MTRSWQRTAAVSELFVSLQGEGPYVGARQAFIRFAGCNLSCAYCDTDHGEKLRASVPELLEFVRQSGKIHSVALTGGEPLAQADFLEELLTGIKGVGQRTYLETNGIFYQELERLAGSIDILAADLKLPSVAGTGPYWDEHREFVRVMTERKINGFLKIVVSAHTKEEDLAAAGEIIRPSGDTTTVVLQPVYENLTDPGMADTLLEWQQTFQEYAADVRVIPQIHKMIGIK